VKTELLLGLLLLAACREHEIRLRIHAPATCCADWEPSCVEACPLSATRSVRILVRESDGLLVDEACLEPEVDGPFCDFEDLTDLTWLDGLSPTVGVDLELEGYSEAGCTGTPTLGCESFGDAVVDLRESASDTVPLWCDCPYRF